MRLFHTRAAHYKGNIRTAPIVPPYAEVAHVKAMMRVVPQFKSLSEDMLDGRAPRNRGLSLVDKG